MDSLNDYSRRFFNGEFHQPRRRQRRQLRPQDVDLRGVPAKYIAPDERAWLGLPPLEEKPPDPEPEEPEFGVRRHPPPPQKPHYYRPRKPGGPGIIRPCTGLTEDTVKELLREAASGRRRRRYSPSRTEALIAVVGTAVIDNRGYDPAWPKPTPRRVLRFTLADLEGLQMPTYAWNSVECLLRRRRERPQIGPDAPLFATLDGKPMNYYQAAWCVLRVAQRLGHRQGMTSMTSLSKSHIRSPRIPRRSHERRERYRIARVA